MNLGLVLSGGGMRGVAHIGAIKALEEYNLYPTHIAGTSVGGIVGALYAYGYGWRDILNFFKSVQIWDIKKYALNKPGFIDTEKFYPYFKNYIKKDDFSFLKKEFRVTATNILNGNLEVFDKGPLITPILASSAFPGIFAPVAFNGSYYIDGGALNNFPVDLLKYKCDNIIGINVNTVAPVSIKHLKHSYNVVERAFKLKSMKEDEKKLRDCDLAIAPTDLCKFGTFDKKRIDEIFKIGYDATIEAISCHNIPAILISQN
ncbi:patatin-like phospholipase family protein [Hyunsoonleella rubra]|uniref:Patatin-like phospholipase family protein n=1 Tax=Hyunsoonleella rubra TaxID=1737062 RepID=A0ABW5T7K2_9FLAO